MELRPVSIVAVATELRDDVIETVRPHEGQPKTFWVTLSFESSVIPGSTDCDEDAAQCVRHSIGKPLDRRIPNSVTATTGIELSAALAAALDQDSVEPWRTALVQQPNADPFRALRNDRAREAEIASAAGFADIEDWLKRAAQWLDHLNRIVGDVDVRQGVLRHAWIRFTKQVQRALREARARLPAEGGVLAYVDGLHLCLVIGYRFVSEMPSLEVIDAIADPRSAFDVVDDLLRRDHPTRNELKRMLQSSHRLIWHRDVLAHVDRRDEPGVFGPSIDTLHVA